MRFAGRSEASCGLPQRHHPLVVLDAVARSTGPNRIGDEARGKMAVMLLDHAGVGVPQVLRHHQQRRAVHDGKRSPGMAQDVEADRGLDLAVVHASAIGRACSDFCHAPPSPWRNINSCPLRPAQ